MKKQWGIGVGSASILITFVLLCLTVFATLSLVSAQADLRLSRRAAETATAYYAADAIACDRLAQLEAASFGGKDALVLAAPELLGTAMQDLITDAERTTIVYRTEIDQNRSIETTISFWFPAEKGTAQLRLEGWQTIQTGGWANEEEPVELWQSGLSGLPNLEGLPK